MTALPAMTGANSKPASRAPTGRRGEGAVTGSIRRKVPYASREGVSWGVYERYLSEYRPDGSESVVPKDAVDQAAALANRLIRALTSRFRAPVSPNVSTSGRSW